jgi:hypothetical protein
VGDKTLSSLDVERSPVEASGLPRTNQNGRKRRSISSLLTGIQFFSILLVDGMPFFISTHHSLLSEVRES